MSDLFLTSDYSLTLPSGGPTFGVHRHYLRTPAKFQGSDIVPHFRYVEAELLFFDRPDQLFHIPFY